MHNQIQGNKNFDLASIISTIKTLSLNAIILNEDIRKVISSLVKESDIDLNSLIEKLNGLKEELKNFENKENYEMFSKFKEDVYEALDSLKIQ